jgi:large subunit ribosomal protein L28
MARTCDVCGKHPSVGNIVSHANNRSKRRWKPNLQRVHANVEGTVRYILACTQCIRSGRVVKASPRKAAQTAAA